MRRKIKNIEVVAEKPIYGGKCLGEYEGKKVIIEKALPGEKVIAKVTRNKKSFIEAKAIEILEKSTHRTGYDCAYFPTCGGCKLLDVSYEEQLKIKEEVVKDCVDRLAKIDPDSYEYLPIISADERFGYRNKMEFTFSRQEFFLGSKEERLAEEAESDSDKRQFSLGFHAPKFYKKTINIDTCYLQSANLNKIFLAIKDDLKKSEYEAYDVMEHTGLLRYLVLRESQRGEVMINLITKKAMPSEFKAYAENIMKKFLQIKSFYNTINSGLATVAFGETNILLAGQEDLDDTIADYHFKISPNSFFQVNPKQTVKLYDEILNFGDFKGGEEILDLYCGVGTISLYVAGKVKSVEGFELIESAVINARENALRNNIENCEFTAGDMKEIVKNNRNLFTKKKYDCLITDPPRDGMHPKVVKSIVHSGINKIIYVSCNPSTFARDLEILAAGGYKLIKARAVDMFPNTYHAEMIGLIMK